MLKESKCKSPIIPKSSTPITISHETIRIESNRKIKNAFNKNVVIYEGAFDPLHNGHKAIIAELYNKFDEIFIVPTKCDSNTMFSDSARVSFIASYVSKCFPNARDKIKILNDELQDETGTLSETVNLIKHINFKYLRKNEDEKDDLHLNKDEIDIYLCIGWDQYKNLKNRYHYEELLKSVNLIVINRGDDYFEKLYSDLNESTLNIELHGYKDISSTKIRNQIYDYVILN